MTDTAVFEYPLDFIVMTDAHYYSKKLGVDTFSYKKYDSTNQKAVKDSAEILSAAFAQIAKSDCETVIFGGDSTCDGDYDSHAEFIELLYALKKCGKRVFAITSTHDYQDDGLTSSYTGDIKTKIPAPRRDELLEMYKDFGPNQAFSQFEHSYASELDKNYILLALNSDKNSKGRSGFSAEHKAWIKRIADAARHCGKRVIAFTHHPIISPSVFYSLIGKNDMMGDHEEIRDFFADLGISLVFTGHSHIHNISFDFSQNGNLLWDVSTSALAGYPGYYRKVRICGSNVHISSLTTEEPVGGIGCPLSDYLENKFIGMIDRTLKAAASDIDVFAANVDAMSIHPDVSYRIGWLVKPFAKLILKMNLGTFAKWVKSETNGADLSDVENEKVFDFIRQLVLHLYSGNAPYNPNTSEYKITMGLVSIIDSLFKTLHIKLSLKDYILPLLYNSGIDDRTADFPFTADRKTVETVCRNKYTETVSESRKGPAVLAALIIAVLILLPLIPAVLLILLIGAGINEIIYYKKIRGIE